ncbi:GyrI-like domain-containing protein [Schlesneria sp. DSM 10557]|uniref:GyrI-like domain-containing protein n=1 Tax=Schlesneria sp. DSM 10557 TaxID=3044399 RepID=UPI00359FD3B3
MKVIVMVKATKDSEAAVMPDEKLLADMGRYNEDLVKAGIMLSGEGLHPSSKGVRVRFSGTKRSVIDGPFAETNELVAGFWMWRVKSMEEAIEWVKRCPNPMLTDSEIEIRPVFEAEDFGESFTPELREQEATLRAKVLDLNLDRFEEGREIHVAGLKQVHNLQSKHQIPDQWHTFVPDMGKVPGAIDGCTYGVTWNCKENGDFDYLCGVEVDPETQDTGDFSQVTLPAGRYAVFTHRDHVSRLEETYDRIWCKWVPDSGLKIRKAPCVECYSQDFNAETGFGGTDIWIPIEA